MPGPRGIRVQVTLVTVVVSLVATAAVMGLVFYASQAGVREIIGQSLSERLDLAEADVAAGKLNEAIDQSGIDLLQAVDESGNVIASTPNAQGYQVVALEGQEVYEVDDLELDELPEAENAISGGPAASGLTALDDAPPAHFVEASNILGTPGPFLVMVRTVDSPDGPVTLVALTSVHLALDVARQTASVLGAILLVLLVLAAAFAWMMTGRTLRPVDTMRREVESISARDLSERITPPGNDPALTSLAETFNGLLARIDASVAEQKRFVSDASHELKSPIAATGLVLQAVKNDPEGLRDAEALDDLLAENARLTSIVDDLLMISRQDEGRLAAKMAPVDFYDLLHEEAVSLRLRSSVRVDESGLQPVIGQTDARLLGHAVRNLLDNAARYARSAVLLSCREDDGQIAITVSDDGPGIPADDRERVFGRFVRLEEGRSRDTGSTGLGLAVARGNVERLGGRVFFAEPEIGGATAVIELPVRSGTANSPSAIVPAE